MPSWKDLSMRKMLNASSRKWSYSGKLNIRGRNKWKYSSLRTHAASVCRFVKMLKWLITQNSKSYPENQWIDILSNVCPPVSEVNSHKWFKWSQIHKTGIQLVVCMDTWTRGLVTWIQWRLSHSWHNHMFAIYINLHNWWCWILSCQI